MRKPALTIGIAALLASASPAIAHTGGPLDADGCHADHRTGTYHCHRGAAAGYTFPNREAMEEAVRTGKFPDKTVEQEGFFSKLWPFGKKHEEESAAPAPADSAATAPPVTAAPGQAPVPAAPPPSAEPAVGGPAPSAGAAVAPEKQKEFEQRLKVLQGLYDMGLITKEEYEAKRKAVLDQL